MTQDERNRAQGSLPGSLPSVDGAASTGEPQAEVTLPTSGTGTGMETDRPAAAGTPSSGSSVLPLGFDAPDGAWRSVRSDDPFERLLLAPDAASPSSADVERHADALLAFWNQKLAALSQGAARDRLLMKFSGGNEDLFRSYPGRIQAAREALADHELRTQALAERTALRVAAGRAKLDGVIGMAMADGHVARAEVEQIVARGIEVGLTQGEAHAYLAERLAERGIAIDAHDDIGVATVPAVDDSDEPRLTPRWPLLAAAALIVGLAAGGYALTRFSRGGTVELPPAVVLPQPVEPPTDVEPPKPPRAVEPPPKPVLPPKPTASTGPKPALHQPAVVQPSAPDADIVGHAAPPPVVPPPIVSTPGLPIDCEAPSRRAHEVVCGDSALKQLDSSVEVAFGQVLASAQADKRDALRDMQYRWRQRRDRCDEAGTDSEARACLDASQQGQLTELRALLSSTPLPELAPPIKLEPEIVSPPVDGPPGPTAGILTYTGPSIVHNGEHVFRGLPKGQLELSYDRNTWEHRLEPGEGNTQRLVMRNKKPGQQRNLTVKWQIVK